MFTLIKDFNENKFGVVHSSGETVQLYRAFQGVGGIWDWKVSIDCNLYRFISRDEYVEYNDLSLVAMTLVEQVVDVLNKSLKEHQLRMAQLNSNNAFLDIMAKADLNAQDGTHAHHLD